MLLYNSLSHRKEPFKPRFGNDVSMYTCGPTVYHFAHIGNLRSYIMEDVLEKYLRYTGYDVNRLKKLYLLRHAREHTLLQTISRVNRSLNYGSDGYELIFERLAAMNNENI